jgi:DNA-binding LytR/AlgR family response regulator
MNIKCIIVDDEPLAREGLERLVSEAGFLDLVAVCPGPMDANRVMSTQAVDLMFLDIQMPRMTGLELLRTLPVKPLVIITTAYPGYAVEGFELHVLDYLLKPITLERFLKAVNRARDAMAARVTGAPAPLEGGQDATDYFFIKTGYGFEKIHFPELLFIEAAQNYCALHTTRGKFLTLSPIHVLEGRLPHGRFLRVQKSYLVSIENITSVNASEVTLGEHRIPVSKSYRDSLLALIDKKLLKR